MEAQARAKLPNSYDVAVRIQKHFEDHPDKHVVTLPSNKLREVSRRTKLDTAFLTYLGDNLGWFGLIMARGGETYVISRDDNFAPYTGGIAILGEGEAYDQEQEQASQANE